MSAPINQGVKLFKSAIDKLFKSVMAVAETKDKTRGLSNAQIKAHSQHGKVSQLLFYRYAEEYKVSDEIKTIYTMDDQRQGFIIEVTPPTYLGDENSADMFEFFNTITTPDVIVHINTFASRNVESKIREYQRIHHIDGVNIERRDILKELFAHEANSMRSWVDTEMGKNGVKLRKFINTISVLFPVDTDIKEITNTYIDIENALVSYSPKDFTPDKLVATISEFIRPDDLIVDTFHDQHQQLNTQMSLGAKVKLSDENGNFKVGDKWNAVTLTTDRFPREITAFEFQSAFFDPFGRDFRMALSTPFVCSLAISFDNIKKNTNSVLKKAQWNIGQINAVPDTLEKKRPILQDKREENTEIIHNIVKRKEFVLKAQWTLTVFDKNEDELRRSCKLIKKKFNEISEDGEGWILKEESYSPISFQSFLMGLPLQYSEIIRNNLQRFKVLFKSNNAQISPLLSGSKSFGEPVMIFPDRTGNLVGFDIFASSKNYNVIIVGPPGSGKSVLMNKISQSYLGTSALIRLVDIGDSYRDFTYRLGGKFIEADDEDKLCLNFFTKIITKRIYDDILEQDVIKVHGHELTTIVPIIGRMLKTDLRSSFSESDSVDDSLDKKMMVTILEEAIQEAYDRQKSAAGMQTIWEVLQDYRAHYENAEKSDIVMLLDGMIIGLHDYVIRDLGNGKTSVGKNFNFFNGVNNLDFEKDLFTFEMEKLTKKGEDILEIVSMSVLHQIANEAYFIKGKRKIVGMDETARLLANPLFVNYIDDFSRRIRKYDGALVLLTQYVKDFNKNDAAKTLFEGASLKMFPEQSSEAIQDAVDSGMLGLSDGATELMKSTKAKTPFYNEVCIKIDDSLLVVLNKLDVLNYWLFTTNPKDKAKILNYERKYNLEESEGAWMCGLLQKGLNEEDAYKEVLNKRKVA